MRRAPILLGGWLAVAACSDAARGPPAMSVVESLMTAGERHYLAAAYDSARAAWDAVRHAAPGDSSIEARVLTVHGIAALRRTDFDSARWYQQRALKLKHRLGFRDQLYRSYNALGLVAWQQGRLAEALAWFDSAGIEARRKDSVPAIAAVLANVALVRVELGEFAAARRGFERAITVARGDSLAWRPGANATNNLGMLLVRMGWPADAIPLVERALILYRAHDYPPGLEQAHGQLGTAHAALGDVGRASLHLDSALAWARALEDRQAEASNLEAQAALARESGDLRRALALLSQAHTIDTTEGLEVEAGANARARAEIHLALGNAAAARAPLADALDRHRRLGARYEALLDLLELSRAARQARDPAGARRALAAARALADTIDAPSARTSLALAVAEDAQVRGTPLEVLGALAADAEAFRAVGFDRAARADALRARAYLALDRPRDAEAAARSAVRLVERVRGGISSPLVRAGFAVERIETYAALVDALIRQERVAEALVVADAARGRALVERTRDTLAAVEAQLARIADALERLPPAERVAAVERERAVRSQLTAARAALAAERGGSAAGGDLARLPRALLPDEALVEYLVTPARTLAFVATAGGTRAVELRVGAAELHARVRAVRALLGRAADSERAVPALEALHGLLVAPLEQVGVLDGARHLVVVPHGPLAQLPFAALRDAGRDRYLVEDRVIRYASSAAALIALEHRARRAAAPDRVTVFAPFPERLPGTVAEADAVRSVGRVERVVGRRATEPLVRSALGRMQVVHLATHGVLESADPLRSRLELAPGGRGGADGRLEVSEVLATRVRAPWVVLSGCETGVAGSWQTAFGRGDDLSTLADAFTYAGALGVVATLWRVPDRGAAALAGRFYAHLAGAGPAEALALAQRDLLEGPEFRAPYHWAAFAAMGAREWGRDGGAAQTRGGTSVALSNRNQSVSTGGDP